jgi:hypothetical protein
MVLVDRHGRWQCRQKSSPASPGAVVRACVARINGLRHLGVSRDYSLLQSRRARKGNPMTTTKPALKFNYCLFVVAVMAVAAAAYQTGVHVQSRTDEAVMRQHLSDDSIDNETVWQICTPRSTP